MSTLLDNPIKTLFRQFVLAESVCVNNNTLFTIKLIFRVSVVLNQEFITKSIERSMP